MRGGGTGVGRGDHDRRDEDQGQRVDGPEPLLSGVVREILREAEETDRREDELYGDARGDELPEQLRTAEGRKAALADAKRRIEERKGRAIGPQEPEQDVEVDPELVLGQGGRRGGRREWPRVARRELEVAARASGRANSARSRRPSISRRSVASRRTTGSIWLRTMPTNTGAQPSATRWDAS